MPVPVLLGNLIEALERSTESSMFFVDTETGEVKAVENHLLSEAEMWKEGDPPPSLPAWQKSEWADALHYVASATCLPLPDKYDIHEWNIMREFADSFPNERIAGKLQEAIHGKGAFRMFKSVVAQHKLWDAWNKFYLKALVEIAKEWCMAKKVEYREE